MKTALYAGNFPDSWRYAIMCGVSEEKPPEILGGLPHRRPQRRSEKRSGAASKPTGGASKPANGAASGPNGRTSAETKGSRPASGPKRPARSPRARTEPLRQPKQPGGTPPKPASRRPAPPSGPEIVSTVVQAAAELVEIGVSAGARAVRGALSRLPRP